MTTQELAKEVQELKLMTAKNCQEISGHDRRLIKAEEMLEKQTELLLIVRDLANGVKNLGEKIDHVGNKVDDVCSRVDGIEQKPARRWETLITALITFAAGAIATYFFTQAGMH